jgi:hypothetical protein
MQYYTATQSVNIQLYTIAILLIIHCTLQINTSLYVNAISSANIGLNDNYTLLNNDQLYDIANDYNPDNDLLKRYEAFLIEFKKPMSRLQDAKRLSQFERALKYTRYMDQIHSIDTHEVHSYQENQSSSDSTLRNSFKSKSGLSNRRYKVKINFMADLFHEEIFQTVHDIRDPLSQLSNYIELNHKRNDVSTATFIDQHEQFGREFEKMGGSKVDNALQSHSLFTSIDMHNVRNNSIKSSDKYSTNRPSLPPTSAPKVRTHLNWASYDNPIGQSVMSPIRSQGKEH